jgi:hypothetical protein
MIGSIKMDMRRTGYACFDWIHQALDRNTCEFGSVPMSSVKGREFLDQLSEC